MGIFETVDPFLIFVGKTRIIMGYYRLLGRFPGGMEPVDDLFRKTRLVEIGRRNSRRATV